MIIFVDAHFLRKNKHGVSVYIENIYRIYTRQNPQVLFIFGIERDGVIDDEIAGQKNVTVVKYRFGGWLRFIFDIPGICALNRVNIAHTQYMIPIIKSSHTKNHVTIHDVLYEDFPEYFRFKYRYIRSIAFKYSARHADAVSTVSQYSKDRIKHHYSPKKSCISVINNGVGAICSPSGQYEHSRCEFNEYILFVSRFERRKNHLSLINVFSRVLKVFPKIRLILVGFEVDGSKKESVRLADTINIGHAVTFLEGVETESLNNLVKKSLVVVYPSICEGFGIPVIEALSLNPRTIFSETTAMADFSFARQNMFDPYSEESMEKMIMKCLQQPEIFDEQWEFQKSTIATNYNWQKSALDLADVHRGLLFDSHDRSI